MKWENSSSGDRKSTTTSSNRTETLPVEEKTPLTRSSAGQETRPRNAKKVLFAAALSNDVENAKDVKANSLEDALKHPSTKPETGVKMKPSQGKLAGLAGLSQVTIFQCVEC